MLSLILLFFINPNAEARELFEYGQSIRALGMGNAYTAVVDDYNALWYNPAALGRVKGINLTIVDLNLGVNGQNAYDSAQEYQNSTGSGLEKFNTLFGDQLWVGAGGKAALTMPYFGLGLYDSGFFQMEIKNPILPTIDANYVNDYGLVVGGAWQLGPNALMGLTGKKITRAGGEGSFGVSSFQDGNTQAIMDELDKRGSAYGADLGFLFTIPAPLNPTISAVWKDLGATTFLPETGSNRPPRIEPEQIIGASLGLDLPGFDMIASMDLKHLNDYDEQLGKKIHMGLEIGLPLVDIRGGFSQGYYSLGASLDLFLLRLDLAYYGVELGAYPGQDEDRRIEAQLIMEFGFDPSFKLIDISKSAKGRKLKQRR